MPASVAERVRARRSGEARFDSAWLDGRQGLAEAVEKWSCDLAPVRAAIPPRVEQLIAPRQRLRRFRRMVVVLAVLWWQAMLFVVLEWPRAAFTTATAKQGAARRLRKAFEQLGPSYVKFGQFISSGRGLFPDVLVDEFAHCRDAVKPVAWRRLRATVEAEIGPLERHFARFDHRPLAAASIAQVHAATLHDGTPVAVKIRRPRLTPRVESHIRSMVPLARWAQRAFPRAAIADPTELVRLFATTVLEELDFRLEAENQASIALDLEAAGVDDVVVPRPIPGLVTPGILVMERLDGLRFDDLESMLVAGIDTPALLLSGLRALVEGATVFGRFHGDLHAGNVICMPNGHFGLIDFGICARLTERDRAGLQRLLAGIASRNPRANVHGLDLMGAIPEGVDRRFLVAAMMARRRGRQALDVDDVRDGAPRVMQVFADHQLRLPKALVLFLKDVLYLNGSTRLLAPDLDLFNVFRGMRQHFDQKYGRNRVLPDDDPYGPPITADEVEEARRALEKPDEEDEPPPEHPLRYLLQRFWRDAVMQSLIPLGLFLGVNATAGLLWAMATATVWSLGVAFVQRRRGRRAGPLLWFTLLFVLLRGAAGIVTRSDAVYFAPGIANNFIIGGLFALSALARRPAVGLIARALYPFPQRVRRHPEFVRVFTRLTWLWATFIMASAMLQIWLLAAFSTTTFLVVRAAFSWPLGIALFLYSVAYPRRVLAKLA